MSALKVAAIGPVNDAEVALVTSILAGLLVIAKILPFAPKVETFAKLSFMTTMKFSSDSVVDIGEPTAAEYTSPVPGEIPDATPKVNV